MKTSTSLKLNLLVAYPYMKPDVVEILKHNHKDVRVLLDSGAFTAWKAGKEINVDDYCKFIEDLPIKPWRYFTLDVIGDPEKSYKNYEVMLKRGFNPIPIFTRGEDIKMIDKYYETSDVIGLGGLVGTIGNKGFVKAAMKVIGNRKVHWLGFNAREFISHYRPYMCDSSSWTSGIRYASLKAYDANGKWLAMTKKTFIARPSQRIINLISSYGIDPRRFAKMSEWKGGSHDYTTHAIEELGCKSWVKYQHDLESKLKTKFFLAVMVNWQAKQLLGAYKYLTERISHESSSGALRGNGFNNRARMGETTA